MNAEKYISKRKLFKEDNMKTLNPSENSIRMLDLLYKIDKVKTKEYHFNIGLFAGDYKFKEYNYLKDEDWYENDLTPYFEDRFIEFAGNDSDAICLWFYPGLIGEPPTGQTHTFLNKFS